MDHLSGFPSLPSHELYSENSSVGSTTAFQGHHLAPVSRSQHHLSVSEQRTCSLPPRLDHYDPIYPTTLLNITFSDTLFFATLVSKAFNIPAKNCLAAGLLGNFSSALVSSPYVSAKIQELLPEASQSTTKNFDTLIQKYIKPYIKPSFFTYYTVAWSALGTSTLPETLCCILACALIKNGTAHLLETHSYKEPLTQQAQTLSSSNKTMQSANQALFRVIKEFTPDLMASLTRSGLSNIYEYTEGKVAAEDIIPKTLFSTTVFIVATFLYYACYRFLEQVGTQSLNLYQEEATVDIANIHTLQRELQSFRTEGRSEETASLLESQSTTINITERHNIEKFLQAFQWLQSPLVSLFKDPLYRAFIATTYEFRNDPYSKNAIKAFQTIDALELLKNFINSCNTNEIKEEELRAFQTLLPILNTQDINNPDTPMDALIKFFQTHAAPKKEIQSGSLLSQAASTVKYGAIEQEV